MGSPLFFFKIRAEFVHQGMVGQGLGYMTFVLCQAGFDILPVWRCQAYMGCGQVIDEVVCIEAKRGWFRLEESTILMQDVRSIAQVMV